MKYLLFMTLLSSSIIAQNNDTIYVTTDIATQAEEIFSLEKPTIVAAYEEGEYKIPVAVVQFKGVMQGNLCTHDRVGLQSKYEKSDFDQYTDVKSLTYSLVTYKDYRRNKKGIDSGGACLSYGKYSPFVMRINYHVNYSEPARTHIWNLRFDLGRYGKKEFSPIYRLIYWPKTKKWAIR